MSLHLETDRLILRPFKKEDARRIRDLANDKKITSILGLPYPYELKHAEEWIATHREQLTNGTEYPLKIIDKQSNDIIGTITIRVDKINHKGELGYWIGSQFWGRGFATEAAKKMIDFGFNELNLNKVWALALTRNIASKMVLEKAGLQQEGTLRQNRLLQNVYEDMDVYGLLREEYM